MDRRKIYRSHNIKLLFGNRFLNYPNISNDEDYDENKISFIGCKLNTIPFNIINENLKLLDIYGNKIVSIPKELIFCKNLITINLAFNKIKHIPKELFELKNLKEINLGYNKIKKLPDNISSNLKRLYLNNNKLTLIPKEYYKLDILNIKYNKINVPIVLYKNKFVPEVTIGTDIDFYY